MQSVVLHRLKEGGGAKYSTAQSAHNSASNMYSTTQSAHNSASNMYSTAQSAQLELKTFNYLGGDPADAEPVSERDAIMYWEIIQSFYIGTALFSWLKFTLGQRYSHG